MDYINDIIGSGAGEKAVLVKIDGDVNEWGDSVDEKEEKYEFNTVVDSLNRAENEQDAGDFIEGDIRFFVSPNCDVDFEHGDIIEYQGMRYDIDSVSTKTLGSRSMHKEIIAETV